MLSQQQFQQMQQRQQEQQAEGMAPSAALFANLNNSYSDPVSSKPQEEMKVDPRFQVTMGQDVLFGHVQQPSVGFGSFQVNYAPNLEPMLHADGEEKRKLLDDQEETFQQPPKKARTDEAGALPSGGPPGVSMVLKLDDDDGTAPEPVEASKVPIDTFVENDVLSGRGGGTNMHPGNRNFRDLINHHRRSYLKARKNDKPAISRAIVRAIRESGGRFLKKGNKSDSWYEIGDDAAREKTSQALRQRAPEMRKLLFDSEREEARAVAEEQIRRQGMFAGGGVSMMNNAPATGMIWGDHQDNNNVASGMMNPALLQAMAANNKLANGQDPANHQFSTMFSAALLQNGMNRFAPNGA